MNHLKEYLKYFIVVFIPFLIAIFLTSCKSSDSIKFDPDFHVGDAANAQIVPELPKEPISCYDERFEEYACMHVSKVKELIEILTRARIPREKQRELIKFFYSNLPETFLL